MSFYENGLTWPFYLFIYIPLPPPPVPVKLHCGRSLIELDWEGGPHPSETHTKTHTAKNSLSNQQRRWLFFPPSTFSIDHLALSSINLQNALFKLLINTLIDLQKCHHTLRQELLMVVSPQRFSSLQSGSDECQNECVDYSLPGKADGFWFEVSKWTSKVLIEGGKCKCSCYLLVWPKKPIKCVLEERFSIFLYFHRTRV